MWPFALGRHDRISTYCGYVVEYIWGCQFRKTEGKHKAIFANYLPFKARMELRDGLFGGRVETFFLKYTAGPREKVRYVDFTSLYPSVMMQRYPTGHPTMQLTEPFDYTLASYDMAIVYCDVECPPDLLIPLLPSKRIMAGVSKLMFDLTPKERQVYTTVELRKALSIGYKITKIYEVWNFAGADNLFTDYIKYFFKLKTENSGKFSSDPVKFEEQMGFMVDHSKCTFNAGKRSVAKLCLNSLWGKLCQAPEIHNNKVLRTQEDLHKLFMDDTIEPNALIAAYGPDIAEAFYTKREPFIPPNKNINLPVALFTTSYARVKLYELMEEVGVERCLCCDTDSIIYMEKTGEHKLADKMDSALLGYLTDELDEGDYIVSFLSTGCKSYAYRTKKGKEVMKLKGITQTAANKEIITWGGLEQLVQKNISEIVAQHRIFRTQKCGKVVKVEDSKKILRLTFDKRRVVRYKSGNIGTLPF